MKRCPQCGRTYADMVTQCPACSLMLAETKQYNTTAVSTQGTNKAKLGFLIGIKMLGVVLSLGSVLIGVEIYDDVAFAAGIAIGIVLCLLYAIKFRPKMTRLRWISVLVMVAVPTIGVIFDEGYGILGLLFSILLFWITM